MLIDFQFKNYRSFKEENTLSMEAFGFSQLKDSVISYSSSLKVLPVAAIYGKNGSGKSNVIRAFWFAANFIKNAQRIQHEKSEIPVVPFLLDDYSSEEPTEFKFHYIWNNIKYWYGFSANKNKILTEYLYHAPNGQKATIFVRDTENPDKQYTFTENKSKRKLISEIVAENQLFFSVACTVNDSDCVSAMSWFREGVFFSRDYTDIPFQLLEYSDDKKMLNVITEYIKSADVGIHDVQFEFNNEEITDDNQFPDDMPDGIKTALTQFLRILKGSETDTVAMRMGKVKAKTIHTGIKKDGTQGLFTLSLEDESDGTKKLMGLAPDIHAALSSGGVLFVDELEKELHPILLDYIVSQFQNRETNPNNAQLIFTTHNTKFLKPAVLRKDQVYFTEKDADSGVSELYPLTDFTTKTSDNIENAYLVGKYGAVPRIERIEVN